MDNMINGMRPLYPGDIPGGSIFIPDGLVFQCIATKRHVYTPRIKDMVCERRSITADTALGPASHVGTRTGFRMGLQEGDDLKMCQAKSTGCLAEWSRVSETGPGIWTT